ncbi:MAG: hypothetical protein ACYDIE_11365, partial [Candidatus Krumholzibacteriia bacterium]
MLDGSAQERTPGVLRRTVLLGLFTGTAVGAGFLLAGLPNCELMTFLCALAGGVLGRGAGAAVGALAAVCYSLGNPLGPAPLPLLAAQIAGLATAGWLGGATAGPVLARWRAGRRRGASLLALGTGVGATLFYDLLTNLCGASAFGIDWRVTLAGAIPFSVVHVLVNGAQFLLLYAPLLARYRHLARSPLRGGGPTVAAALMLACAVVPGARAAAPADSAAVAPVAGPTAATTAATTAADTVAAPAPLPPFAGAFTTTFVEELARDTAWTPLVDGGLGGRIVLANEADTSPWPEVWRGDMPLGTGHRWTDEPWLVAMAGQEIGAVSYGLGARGGFGGEVRLVPLDTAPAEPVLETRFFKGTHATYLRRLAFRTPRAPWRARFDFEERLDREGYVLSPAGDLRFANLSTAGASAFRSGRGVLERVLEDGSRLRFAVERIRHFRTVLPATGTVHEETWLERAELGWRGRGRLGAARGALFVASADVQREWPRSSPEWRRLEVTREGFTGGLTGGDGRRWLSAVVLGWRLHDTGADSSWAGGAGGAVDGSGAEASVRAGLRAPWSGVAIVPSLGLAWADPGGSRPCAALSAEPAAGGWWRLDLEVGGRAPRSDELLTVDRAEAPDRLVVLGSNRDLGRERVARAALALHRRVWGTDLAATGSVRSLRDGIVWTAPADTGRVGRWENGLDLDGRVLTAGLSRTLRFAGLLRLRADAVWRGRTVRRGVAWGEPPARAASLAVDWERSAFHGDGVWHFGWRLERTGAYDDPWLPVAGYRLPARALQHLLLAFRLVGADL